MTSVGDIPNTIVNGFIEFDFKPAVVLLGFFVCIFSIYEFLSFGIIHLINSKLQNQ